MKKFLKIKDILEYPISQSCKDYWAAQYNDDCIIPIWDHINKDLKNSSALELALYLLTNKISEEEKNNAEKALEIKNCKNYFSSWNISDSENVIHSNSVKNSSYIFLAHDIADSNFIKDGTYIKNSELIFNSSNIFNSYDVCNSDNIENSKHIYGSSYIKNSNFLEESVECEFCNFSKNLQHCSYCLFCDSLKDKTFYIFNKEATAREYFICVSLLLSIFESQNSFICNYNKEKNYFEIKTLLYENVPDKFFEVARTVPYFTEFLLYKITLNKKSFR